MSRGRRARLAAVVVPMLLLLACGAPSPLMQTITLAGSPAGLEKFTGGWYDCEGELIAVISSGADSRFNLQLAIPTEYLSVTGARLQGHDILLTLQGGGTLAIQLLKASIEPEICGCFSVSLQQDPFYTLSIRRAARFARKAYEDAFDRLSRIL
jgi:hypothetical protein